MEKALLVLFLVIAITTVLLVIFNWTSLKEGFIDGFNKQKRF